MDAITLAEVALEVAERYPDTNYVYSRAEWRWVTIEKAIEIVKENDITRATDDIDEIVAAHLYGRKTNEDVKD